MWFLRLFPQYRRLEAMARETAERMARLEDLLDSVQRQNLKLADTALASRLAEIDALKMMVNIKTQREYGGLPPYSEAYSLPLQPDLPMGPVPVNRQQGRDAVRQGIEEFHASIRELSGQHRNEAS